MLMDITSFGGCEDRYIQIEKREVSQNRFYTDTFKWMFIGLMVSAITAFITAFFGTMGYVSSPLMFILCLVEVALVLLFSKKFDEVSENVALLMYFLITFVNGITLSSIFYVYDLGSIALSFVLAAVMFGVMAVYGNVTKRDISKWLPMLIVALITCLIALIINLFIGNTWLDILISIAVIVVMMLVTAYDFHMMKYKEIREMNNAHIYFALAIYLDFLNIFLYVLRLFGIKAKD